MQLSPRPSLTPEPRASRAVEGFPSSAVLREHAAVLAAEAMRPVLPLMWATGFALLIAAGYLFYAALAHADACLALAARV